MSSERRATCIAHPNIALAKYWGKKADPQGALGNVPAVPSLSVTLRGMATTTRVAFDDALGADRLILNGSETAGEALARASGMLDRVRAAAGVRAFAEITSSNDFPTGGGLASSASGFAALALAATAAIGLDWDAGRVSDLARRSSASAARGLFGGFVELDPRDAHGELLAARPVVPADALGMRVLVCVATEAPKAISSTAGMNRTAAESPYYGAWLDRAPSLFSEIKSALLRGDFEAVGALSEASALAMHASALAAGVVYFSGVTIDALAAVRKLRERGTPVFSTIDAGPHVKVLTRDADVELVGRAMREVPGVLRVIEARPGDGARILEDGTSAATPQRGQHLGPP